MSTDKDTGGAAFPTAHDGSGEDGMTLRDYFAAKAMQGYLSDEAWRIDMNAYQTAICAYRQADAMLEAMGKT